MECPVSKEWRIFVYRQAERPTLNNLPRIKVIQAQANADTFMKNILWIGACSALTQNMPGLIVKKLETLLRHQYRICVMPVKGLFSKAGNTMIRDTGIIAVASIIVAVTVIFKERAIASRFGVGDVTNAFALASATVVFLATVFGGSLALSLIPALMRVEIESGQTVAEELCRAVLAYLLLGMVTIATAIYVFSEPIISVIGGSFSSEKQKLTGDLLVVMLPLLPLGGWAAYVTALLNARGGFFISTTAQAAIPLAVVIVLYIAPTPYALVGGLVLGYFAQCLVLAVALRNRGRWLLPQWRAPRNDMKAVWGQYLPVTIGAAFMGSTVVTDQVMAGWLAPGSVATLAFASVLVNYLNAFGGRLLGAPALTHSEANRAKKVGGSKPFDVASDVHNRRSRV